MFSGRAVESQATSARPKTILHIPSQHSLSDSTPDSPASLRDQIYNSAAVEKNARAAEFSNIKRALSKDVIVISDSLNYIKGYRYQLWCEAKAVGTRCCVIHVAARADECQKWNRERLRNRGDGAEDKEGETTPVDTNSKEQDSKKPAGFGELVPESHTALYGDGEDFEPRSRSSSLDVQLENGPPALSLASFSLQDAKPEAPPSLASLSLVDNSKNELGYSSEQSVYRADKDTDPASINAKGPHPPLNFPTSLPYSSSTLQSVILRYEPPSPFSRWDTPLFTLPSTDPNPPYDAIWSALFPSTAPSRKTLTTKNGNLNTAAGDTAARGETDEVKPHAATVLPPSTSAQALQLLERTTADLVASLFAAYKDQNIGDGGGDLFIDIPSTTDPEDVSRSKVEITVSIPPGTILTQPMLQRLRRKFTQMQRGGIAHGRGHAVERGRRGLVEAFGRFLKGEFES